MSDKDGLINQCINCPILLVCTGEYQEWLAARAGEAHQNQDHLEVMTVDDLGLMLRSLQQCSHHHLALRHLLLVDELRHHLQRRRGNRV